jgi:spore germination protein GerM
VRRFLGVLALVALGAACRGEGVTVIPAQELPRDVYGSPLPQPTSTVRLPEQATVYLVEEGRLRPVSRQLSGEANSLPAALLFALLSPVEEARVHSAIPADSIVNSVTVAGALATVDLSEEFEAPGSVRSQAMRVAQVVYTLTEPETRTGITSVQVTIEGEEGVPGDSGELLEGPVTRRNYDEFAPRPA